MPEAPRPPATNVRGTKMSQENDEYFVPAVFREVVGFHLRIAQEASFEAFGVMAGKANLKPGWYALLTILNEAGSMTPSELSRHCGRDRSTLTSTLKALAARGLIQRERKSEDQRSYEVRLTAIGCDIQRRLHAIAIDHERHLDEILGQDKAMLLAILRRIASRV
ncbi:MarR family transcriptional regulator (plasmid) [Bosea vestrisii]|uniref:MarR family winged helix-turn-helix transcriptional regulator n=1 Tax=Bosea vestrisii TaxID=151416 RepID=UPI0024DFB596|nr:MarR family transcriptional regulator [Bosea vestrisii]WID99854.1 MarR family transcriptional regulator [Bosea vestrisii]